MPCGGTARCNRSPFRTATGFEAARGWAANGGSLGDCRIVPFPLGAPGLTGREPPYLGAHAALTAAGKGKWEERGLAAALLHAPPPTPPPPVALFPAPRAPVLAFGALKALAGDEARQLLRPHLLLGSLRAQRSREAHARSNTAPGGAAGCRDCRSPRQSAGKRGKGPRPAHGIAANCSFRLFTAYLPRQGFKLPPGALVVAATQRSFPRAQQRVVPEAGDVDAVHHNVRFLWDARVRVLRHPPLQIIRRLPPPLRVSCA